jgi:hypothetical protein
MKKRRMPNRKWIAMVSKRDKGYNLGIHLTKIVKGGRPKDFYGNPMIAKKPEIEQFLKEIGV